MSDFTLVPESQISHYRVDCRIGAGGMGEVFKATDLTLERSVALKILPPSLLGDAERVRRFVQEAKSASALNHPNIVTIYEIGQSPVEFPEGSTPDGQHIVHYMAMEFIDGKTLRAMIHGGTPLSELLRVLAQAADGLAKAHDAGIVHRDLKPDNIMITKDGFTKVVDFGLAKLTEQKGQQKGLTQTGMVMGTVGYMSPEQVEGTVTLPPSDIFSFGCILYECAARKRPFESDLAIDTLHKIMFSEPMPVSAYLPDAHPRLQPLIDRCLKKKAPERPTMREIATVLREISGQVSGAIAGPAAQATMMLDALAPMPTPPPSAPPQSRPMTAPRIAETPLSTPQPAYTAPSRRPRIRLGAIFSTLYKLALLGAVAIVAYVWATMPDVRALRQTNPPASQWADYGDFAPSLRRAVVAAVDPQFYDRRTLDPKKPDQVMKALTSADRARYMPSELTKAVAREVYPAATWNPAGPARAWAVASAMERHLSRRRILEIYLNLANFGEAEGANAAAKRYFRKAPSRLTEDEAVLLSASLFASPFDPERPSSEITAARASILEHLPKIAAESAPAPSAPAAKPPSKKRRQQKAAPTPEAATTTTASEAETATTEPTTTQ